MAMLGARADGNGVASKTGTGEPKLTLPLLLTNASVCTAP
jgi:hypothetical protein